MIEYQIALHGHLQCFDGEGKVVEQPMQIHGLAPGNKFEFTYWIELY